MHEGDTFECPPPCMKPSQWPFGHVAVKVACGGGRADARGMEARTGHWAMGREEEQGSGGMTRKGATMTRAKIKGGMKKQ
jgi:hypothetical protein